jgi:Spy/CpxP family protein refolding chaperone
MAFSADRRKAAALVVLVFVLGIAFGVVGVLAGRRVLSAANRTSGNSNGQGQQLAQLVHDLNLTSGQERQFRQILADTRDRYNAIRKSMDPQFQQVREQNRQRIEQILTPEQRPEFQTFLQESRNRRNDRNNPTNRRNDQSGRSNQGSNTSQVTRLTQELHLTADQQTQLSGILRDTRASFDALRQQMNPQFEEARLQNRESLRQVLTAEQRPGLDAFFQQRDEERRRNSGK